MFTRIIDILKRLSNGEQPTLAELAKDYNMDARTIRRDITERLQFFPVELKGGVARIKEGFSLERSGLRDDELLIAELAFSAIHGMNAKVDEHLHAIRAKLSYPLFFTPYHVKAEGYEEIRMNSGILNKIEDAIAKNNVSSVRSQGITSRVEPYKVVAFDGIWYLFAKDLEDDKVKTYLISQIEEFRGSLQIYTSDLASIDKMLENVHTAWFEDGNSFEVTIRVQPEIAHFFKLKKHLSSQEIIKEYRDGSLVVTFSVSTDEDVDNLIKAWLPHIEVLKPERFRKRLLSELETYISMLKSPQLEI